ncbi:hypothetical protein ASD16_12035 [Cellulomonas sp. Root485]|uniref:hypothetical protein n=1 Tax=Cellulomonas sp. Root485 TaxID=1736546 RepID=UPI000700482C|nr:hypothetical protein [Cellulomonas sp. Root485]KQY23278.1 hypothetical protein ASD16_12035 [Cellulomonas sp. Root485]
MARQRREPSFQEVVDALKATPTASTAIPEAPGIYADGTVIAPDGRAYLEVASDVSSAVAFDAAAAGAQVVWDSCGCGGYCALTWFDEAEVARMVASGRPTIRRTKKAYGSIAEHRSADGRALLLVERDVRWGSVLG